MATEFSRPVRRRTVGVYRFALTHAIRGDATGRKLVVELKGDDHGDLIRIREERRRDWVELDVAELYRKAVIQRALAGRKARGRGRG